MVVTHTHAKINDRGHLVQKIGLQYSGNKGTDTQTLPVAIPSLLTPSVMEQVRRHAITIMCCVYSVLTATELVIRKGKPTGQDEGNFTKTTVCLVMRQFVRLLLS